MLTELKPVLALHCNEYIISSLYNGVILIWCSLRKQPTFCAVSTGFPEKWRLRNERRNSILMTRHYPDLGRVSDRSWRLGNLLQPIRSTTQTWLVTHHQYGFSALVSQIHFARKPVGSSRNVACFVKLDLMLFKYIKRENSFFFFKGNKILQREPQNLLTLIFAKTISPLTWQLLMLPGVTRRGARKGRHFSSKLIKGVSIE